MVNLTISVNGDVLKQARIRALEEDTSVNTVLGKYLEEYVRLDESRRRRKQALENLLRIAEKTNAGSAGKKWSREELYER